ncbi:MAG: type I 3-dehydroquinate dehydratase [Chthoniobacteraceae bacterium]
MPLPRTPATVGTIHSPAALREALDLPLGAVDFLEVRVDHFVRDLAPLRRAIPKLKAPLIVTVRHPAEGGAAKLGYAMRAALYREFMPVAAFIDIELRSAHAMRAVLEEAKEAKVGRIVSWHNFITTPPVEKLRARWLAARAHSPDVIKFATRARTAAHLATLLTFLAHAPRKPGLSVMGMREFGQISRLALAAAGSVLNYGYLGEQQLAGQWPAPLLSDRLAELNPPE